MSNAPGVLHAFLVQRFGDDPAHYDAERDRVSETTLIRLVCPVLASSFLCHV